MAVSGPSRTLVEALRNLPRDPQRGYRFIGLTGQLCFFSYDELVREAYRRAAFLQALGLKKGDRVAMVVPEGHEFVLTFLGAVVAGVVPVPIYPRATFKAVDAYVDIVAHIVRASGARVLVTMRETESIVNQVMSKDAGLERIVLTDTAFAGAPPAFTAPNVEPGDLCFLQFTSGSTSKPKGVSVTHDNLRANGTSFLGPNGGLDRRETDISVTWLPLYHDMGLIGFVLGPLFVDLPTVVLPTSTFARGPRIWLETIHKVRGTVTWAPNFAYALAAKRVRDRDLQGLDLSCLRLAGCGAEPIQAQTMRDFVTRLAPAKLNQDVMLPSYGMAEATLAISFHPVGTPLVTDWVDGDQMKQGNAAKATPGAPGAFELVSCGVPFAGHEIAIVDDDGKPLPARRVGQILSRGPSTTAGYFNNAEASREGFRNGWLYTGDLGYIADGNLYICGRLKDLIIIHGANYYPQDIEWAVGDLEGVRRGNVIAFSVTRDGEEKLVVCAEAHSGDVDAVKKRVTDRVYEMTGLAAYHVAVCPVGALPKTSSGKAQRRKAKALFEEGTLPEHGNAKGIVDNESET